MHRAKGYIDKWERTNKAEWDWEWYSAANEDGGWEARRNSAHVSQRQLASQIEVGYKHVYNAMLILRHAPAEAKQVMRGTKTFNSAYTVAKERKHDGREFDR